MSQGDISDVRSAIVKRFIDEEFFDEAHLSFENVAYEPPSGEAWAKIYFMPTDPIVATLGDEGQDRVDGLVQIDLNFPLNQGTADIGEMATRIRNLFTVGSRPAYCGQEVVIKACGRSQGREVNGFYRISVSVYFYAHINRS